MYYIVFNDKTLTLYKFANPKLIRISAETFKRVLAPLADSTEFIPLNSLEFTQVTSFLINKSEEQQA